MQENHNPPSDRKFGLTFTVIFLGLGIYSAINMHTIIAYLCLFAAIAFCIVAFTNAKILAPLNKMWMRFGEFLQRLVSPIVLSALYFSVFTPVGLITKAFGRDELKIKFNRQDTNWEKPSGRVVTRSNLKQQF